MNIPRETLDELVKLRDRVAYLEAEIELLRDEDATHIAVLVSRLGVTVRQARILAVMVRGILTRDQAIALALHRVEDAARNSLDTQIKHLRKRLPWLKVKTIYGLGYVIEDPASKKRIQTAMQEAQR